MRLDTENHQEALESLLQSGQVRVRNPRKIRVSLQDGEEEEEEEENHWVLSIVQDLVTAVLDEDSQLKSLDIAGWASPVEWDELPPEVLAHPRQNQ